MEARKIAEMDGDSASQALPRAEGSQLMADGDGRTSSLLGKHPSIMVSEPELITNSNR